MINDILGLPTFIPEINITCYPISLLDYPKFMMGSWLLKYDKRHVYIKSEETTNFEAILLNEFPCEESPKELTGNNLVKYKIECLTLTIAMVTNKVVSFNYSDLTFYLGENKDEGIINKFNYDIFREVVCNSNLIKIEKFYKSKRVAERIKAFKQIQEQKGGMGYTEVISIIHIYTGIPYEVISKYTYFQLMHTFARINKMMEYKQSLLCVVNGGKCDIANYAEEIKLNIVDDSDLFKKAGDINSMIS